MNPIVDFITHARTSWKTTLAGLVAAIALNGPQIQQLFSDMNNPGFDWWKAILGLAVLLGGAAARDGNKRSEDHALIEDPSNWFKDVPKLILLVLVLGMMTPDARAEFVAVKATSADAVGHIELKPSVAPHAVEGTATIEHNGELHEGAISFPITIASGAFKGTATATASTTAPLIETHPKTFSVEAPVTFNGTPNMLHLEFSIPPHAFDNMIVVHAEGATETAVKPFQQIVQSAVGDAREYAFWIAVGAGAVAVVSIGLAIAVHFHHMKQRAKLEAAQ